LLLALDYPDKPGDDDERVYLPPLFWRGKNKAMIKFTKMHGLSNDFIIIDCRKTGKMPPRATMSAMTHRKTGIGCDQLIPILPPQDERADAFMRIINRPDATEAQACGNATRCVADILMNEKGEDAAVIQTVAGLLYCTRDNASGLITVDMGVPRVEWNEIPLSKQCDTLHLPLEGDPVAVNIGNPHCVFFVDDAESYNVAIRGPLVENDPLFPEKTNVEYATVLDRAHIRMRVWERDAGETEACGSAACGTIVAAVRRGLVDRQCEVMLNGGPLQFHWREEDDHLLMTGPVAYVFEGTISFE
jgi:diaminopimelate epimerase